MRKTYLAIGALALLGVLVIAGCGGGGSSSSATTSGGGGSEESTSETASSSSGGGRYGSGESEASSATEEGGEAKSAAAGSGETAGGGGTAMAIKVAPVGDLGKVLVDAEGMTVYDFHKDKGSTSSCYGACEQGWPPVLTNGEPKAMSGAQASMLGTTKRKDGSLQVTYNGRPLYTFVEDKKPGEANGNDVDAFGAEWYALEPNGEEPDDDDS
jgi:predicted lipoprotein with Yx(FWY)xxD motif